jgi:hypothetical protein
MRARESGLWVVYRMRDDKKADGRNVVCEQNEWDEMQRRRPGYYTLVRQGIASEAEADRLARGTSGDALKSGYARMRS